MHRLIWDRFQIGIRHRFQIVRGLVKRGHASPPMVATSPITTPEAPRASSTKLIKRSPRLRPLPAIVTQVIAAAIPSLCSRPHLFIDLDTSALQWSRARMSTTAHAVETALR
jgi:hypothetical protein